VSAPAPPDPPFAFVGTVPWGRNRAEYAAFLDLGGVDPATRILDVGGGPSSFAAEMGALGRFVVAADPIYADGPLAIAARIAETRGQIMAGLASAADRFHWDVYRDPAHLEEVRMSAMGLFLEDLARDRAGRYVAAALPRLPFAPGAFDLVLISHLLFLYSTQLDQAFHQAAVTEALRIAPEVRIFPLIDLSGVPSAHLQPVRAAAARAGASVEIRPVPYAFQKGADRMLVLRRT
jgi:SAM-dependent methyltransferase